MAGEYTIKILSSEEFSKLPFKRIMENPGTVFGAADPRTKTAYIRDTGYNDITKATISHELDELVAGISPHEEDGIRYKDFSQSFGNFLGNVPVIGKPLSAVGNLVGGGIDLLGAGARKVGLPSFNIGQPSPAATTANLFSAPSLAGSNQGGKAVEGLIGQFPAMSGASAANVPAAGGNVFSNLGNTFQDLWSGMTGKTPSAGPTAVGGKDVTRGKVAQPPTGQQGTAGPSDFWEQAKAAAPGTIVSMLGNLFAPKVSAPDFSGVKADLAKRIGEGGSPAFDLGFGEAQRILDKPIGVLPETVLEPIYQRRDQELEALDQQFRLNQQGGQSSLRDATRYGELRSDIIEKYESEIQQLAFQYEQQQELNRMNVMNTLLNLDQAQFEQYQSLAALDVATLMEQYGLDVQTATDFKTLFGNVGSRMLDAALNPQTGITRQEVEA